jgi:C1A family cysteine protease
MLYTYGPVMVGVYANTAFTQYSSGVFNGCPLDATNYINHAVLLVGYNDATSSWLIKNQWGNWGESGYIRLSYTYDCGLSTLIGKVAFTSTNANPNIIVNDPTLLFSNAKWEGKLSLALLACTLLLSAFLF